jgi:hypothetical protein
VPPALVPTAAPAAVARPPLKKPSEEEIRLCAYRKWEQAGRPAGDGVCFWVEAEKALNDGEVSQK